MDPVGCIIISLIICQRWIDIMTDQMEKVTGKSAPDEYITTIRDMVTGDSDVIGINRMIVYYSGARYNIEVDIVVTKHLNVEAANHVETRLQNMLEDLPDIERANIHVRFVFVNCWCTFFSNSSHFSRLFVQQQVDANVRTEASHKVDRELIAKQQEMEGKGSKSPAGSSKEDDGVLLNQV